VKGPILLVEEDRAVRETLAAVMRANDYEVIQAVSVKTALMHLDVVDLLGVVLDVRLPNGHGREVVTALVDKRNDVPVVILSAFHGEDEWDFPVIAVLKKPYADEVEEFRLALLAAVDKAAAQSEAIRSIRNSTRRLRDLPGTQ
jgi:DNA-binding NtrC family response regulator